MRTFAFRTANQGLSGIVALGRFFSTRVRARRFRSTLRPFLRPSLEATRAIEEFVGDAVGVVPTAHADAVTDPPADGVLRVRLRPLDLATPAQGLPAVGPRLHHGSGENPVHTPPLARRRRDRQQPHLLLGRCVELFLQQDRESGVDGHDALGVPARPHVASTCSVSAMRSERPQSLPPHAGCWARSPSPSWPRCAVGRRGRGRRLRARARSRRGRCRDRRSARATAGERGRWRTSP